MPRPKPFVALYGQVDFDKMIPADNISGTDIFVCRQGADGDNVFATASQLNDFFGVPDPILLNDGSAAAPSYSFASDPTTGIFITAAGQLRVATAGISRWLWVGNDFQGNASGSALIKNQATSSSNPTLVPNRSDPNTGIGHTADDQLSLIAGGVQVANLTEAAGIVQFIVPLQNNAAAPSIAFGDGDTGFYEESDDTIGVTSVGIKRFEFSGNSFRADTTSGPLISNVNASATVPTLIPDKSDINTGIGHNVSDQLSFIAGGLTCISIRNIAGARQVGFYDGSPISLQTGVAVTTSAVHAALVNLRLITA